MSEAQLLEHTIGIAGRLNQLAESISSPLMRQVLEFIEVHHVTVHVSTDDHMNWVITTNELKDESYLECFMEAFVIDKMIVKHCDEAGETWYGAALNVSGNPVEIMFGMRIADDSPPH